MRDTCLRFLAKNKVFFFLCVCVFSRVWRGTFFNDAIFVPHSCFATCILEFSLIKNVYASIIPENIRKTRFRKYFVLLSSPEIISKQCKSTADWAARFCVLLLLFIFGSENLNYATITDNKSVLVLAEKNEFIPDYELCNLDKRLKVDFVWVLFLISCKPWQVLIFWKSND